MKPEPKRVKSNQLKPIEPMKWYVQAFQKYADFNGSAGRSEYWYFVLINALMILGINIPELFFGTYGILGTIYAFGTIIPALAVPVRRLHDTGRSGWTILLSLIPLIGGVIVLIFLLQDSQAGENQYGGGQKKAWRVSEILWEK